MCGIIGYAGARDALPILLQGIENLEYPAYASAGVALSNGSLAVYKRAGTIDQLLDIVPEDQPATCGIGHTRWSTHGPPTDANAHPHTDCTGRVAVVHNGIIENETALRAELSGHTFVSDTDTEVIPHLIEASLAAGCDLVDAVRTVTDQLTGSYAFVATVADADCMVAAREDSPLVIGHGEDGIFLASDVTAFLEHTRQVSYLEDGDLIVVRDGSAAVHRDGTVIEPAVETVEWEATAAEKGGYEHYMLKEIHEQPTALRQTIASRIDTDAGDVSLALDVPAAYWGSLEEIQFVACGTSAYAAAYAARLTEELAAVRASVTLASEYAITGGRDPWRTLVVAVTQSGETADTLAAIRTAAGTGARTLAVTNTLGSTVTREVDDSVFIRAGPEIGVAATKTFASQVATLALLCVHVGRRRETLPAGRARTVLESLRAVPGAIQQALDCEDEVAAVAYTYADRDAFFFIGRDLAYPVAQEGALKLKEISYDHAEGFAAGELKHGPLALVTDQTPVLAVMTDGGAPDRMAHAVTEVQSRGAPVIAVTSTEVEGQVAERFVVPSTGVFEPLVANVYWQLFAYHVANAKGRPIDKPRNLAKSVTVQ